MILIGHLDWKSYMRGTRDQGVPDRPLKYSRLEVVKVYRRQRKPWHTQCQLQTSGAGRLWDL
jgi:hypothetical protein